MPINEILNFARDTFDTVGPALGYTAGIAIGVTYTVLVGVGLGNRWGDKKITEHMSGYVNLEPKEINPEHANAVNFVFPDYTGKIHIELPLAEDHPIRDEIMDYLQHPKLGSDEALRDLFNTPNSIDYLSQLNKTPKKLIQILTFQ